MGTGASRGGIPHAKKNPKMQRRPTLAMVERNVTTILQKFLDRYHRMEVFPVQTTLVSLGVGFLVTAALALTTLVFTLFGGEGDTMVPWYIEAPLALVLWAAGLYALLFLYGEVRGKWKGWKAARARKRREAELEQLEAESEEEGDTT